MKAMCVNHCPPASRFCPARASFALLWSPFGVWYYSDKAGWLWVGRVETDSCIHSRVVVGVRTMVQKRGLQRGVHHLEVPWDGVWNREYDGGVWGVPPQ